MFNMNNVNFPLTQLHYSHTQTHINEIPAYFFIHQRTNIFSSATYPTLQLRP
jgi:hypothetical protein